MHLCRCTDMVCTEYVSDRFVQKLCQTFIFLLYDDINYVCNRIFWCTVTKLLIKCCVCTCSTLQTCVRDALLYIFHQHILVRVGARQLSCGEGVVRS